MVLGHRLARESLPGFASSARTGWSGTKLWLRVGKDRNERSVGLPPCAVLSVSMTRACVDVLSPHLNLILSRAGI